MRMEKTANKKMHLVRLGVCVFLLFLTLLLLILSITTRVRVKETGQYSTKNEVALYLYTYHHLPSNYVSKRDPSIKDTSVPPSDGRYFGGDVHYYKKRITEYTTKTDLRECDLSYSSTENRGSKRLVYSTDFTEIFYTYTHYGDNGDPAFVSLSKKDIQKTSDTLKKVFIFVITFEVIIGFSIVYQDNTALDDFKESGLLFLTIVFFVIALLPFTVGYLIYFLIKTIQKKDMSFRS